MFSWIKNIFSSPAPRPESDYRRAYHAIKARYDAAQWTEQNRRHWVNADHLSAKAANRLEVRRALRTRARYVVANNGYAQRIVRNLCNHVIGRGPRPQITLPNDDAARRVQDALTSWMQAIGLTDKLRTMRKAKAVDGEAFAVRINNPRLEHAVKLDLRLVECDQVSSPFFSPDTLQQIDGVVLDRFGNPLEYHVLRQHPGDYLQIAANFEFDRIPAADVCHWFRVERPGQVRGVSEFAGVLEVLEEIRRYRQATRSAMEIAADLGVILYTDTPADGSSMPGGDIGETIPLERGQMMAVPDGWKPEQMRAEHPGTSQLQFSESCLTEAGGPWNMPKGMILGDSSGYNFASGKLDNQTYYAGVNIERAQCERIFLQPLTRAWLDEASLIPGLLPSGQGLIDDWQINWHWDGHEDVDRAKEANATAQELGNNLTTLARECAKRGLDWEEVLRQRAKEVELLKALGLPIFPQKGGGQPAGPSDNQGQEDTVDASARPPLRAAAEQPRVPAGTAEGGQFASKEGTLADGTKVTFVPHPNSTGHVMVMADPKKLDASWQKDESYYLPTGSKGQSEVAGRRENFERFLAKGQPIQAPKISLEGGNVSFEDGRHRFAVLRDKGIDKVAVMVPKADAAEAHSRFGASNPVKATGEPIHA